MHHYTQHSDKREYSDDHYQNAGYGNYQRPYSQTHYQQPQSLNSLFSLDLTNSNFWKGAALGAVVALLVTNDSVQKNVVKAVSKVTTAARFGIEELKEKFEDAKAEVEAEAQAEAEDQTEPKPE